MNRRNFLKRAGLGAAGVAGLAAGLGVGGDDSPKTMTLTRTEPLADGEKLMANDLNTFQVQLIVNYGPAQPRNGQSTGRIGNV